MGKLIQLKLSDANLKRYDEIAKILGYAGVFGGYQKAIDFCIDYTMQDLKKRIEEIPGLDRDKTFIFFSTLMRIKKEGEGQIKEQKQGKSLF